MTGLQATVHRKVWADLGVFVAGGYEWQEALRLGEAAIDAGGGWRALAGLSWQMPMAWLELL